MRLHGTAVPAGQAWSPAAAPERSALAEASADDTRQGGTSQRPVVSVHDAQGPLTPEPRATASRQFEGGGAPPSGAGRIRSDGPARWLTASMVSLAVLAAASAVVSYSAQYRMVFAAKAVAPVAALEAAIPDVAALVFATLGIALALHGKRAIRARVLNVAAVITSVAMNVLAAGPGWRDLLIWAMPPVAYALASDTAIGVIRAWTLARQEALKVTLADDEATPLSIVGGLLLWLLRLGIAPVSTLAGFRAWVIDECPAAPGRRTRPAQRSSHRDSTPRPVKAITVPSLVDRRRGARAGTKTARFLDLVASRYGPLDAFPLADVSRVASELAPEADLNTGTARAALRRRVLSLRNGSR
jgi:hypothetical protein